MSYGTSLYDKINFFIMWQTSTAWGVSGRCLKISKKIFLTFLGLGTNVVKVSSVNSELLFQWDTLKSLKHARQKQCISKKQLISIMEEDGTHNSQQGPHSNMLC